MLINGNQDNFIDDEQMGEIKYRAAMIDRNLQLSFDYICKKGIKKMPFFHKNSKQISNNDSNTSVQCNNRTTLTNVQ